MALAQYTFTQTKYKQIMEIYNKYNNSFNFKWIYVHYYFYDYTYNDNCICVNLQNARKANKNEINLSVNFIVILFLVYKLSFYSQHYKKKVIQL